MYKNSNNLIYFSVFSFFSLNNLREIVRIFNETRLLPYIIWELLIKALNGSRITHCMFIDELFKYPIVCERKKSPLKEVGWQATVIKP